jgi:hypothetical protein
MANYLTYEDEQNYGRELLDVSQRAALQAVAPHLAQLQQQNATLQSQVAGERRRRLDREVEQAIPNYRDFDRDPRWHHWLLGIDLMSARVRQTLLNEAISIGNAPRVISFFRQFERQAGQPSSVGGTGNTPGSAGASSRRRGVFSKPFYDNASIKKLYEDRRRGVYSEAEFARIEADLFAAQREGRVIAAPFFTK